MNPRLRRLQADYDLIRESLSGHPQITVQPAGAELPPESYVIEYRIRGLELNDSQPEFREVHQVQLNLPLQYPAERPHAVPLTPVFHPNIRSYYCIADYWAAGTTLVDVIAKMGDMLQWKIYNANSPLDVTAARWAKDNEESGIFPVDNVDFGVEEIEIGVKPHGTPDPSPPEPVSIVDDSEEAVPDAGMKPPSGSPITLDATSSGPLSADSLLAPPAASRRLALDGDAPDLAMDSE